MRQGNTVALRPLAISGAFEILTEPHEDNRGFFARTLDLDVLREHGLRDGFDQESLSYNQARGTLRGLHYQADPAWESKIVTCVAGRVFDVVLDLRHESPSYGRWDAVELDALRCNSMYIPVGCAHGFQTLDPETRLLYRITPAYVAELARGIHPYDEEVAVRWPIAEATLSERDLALPRLRDVTP